MLSENKYSPQQPPTPNFECLVACVQTSPISFVATKEIGDVCREAKCLAACLHPIRTCFFLACTRLDATDGKRQGRTESLDRSSKLLRISSKFHAKKQTHLHFTPPRWSTKWYLKITFLQSVPVTLGLDRTTRSKRSTTNRRHLSVSRKSVTFQPFCRSAVTRH